MDSVLNSAHISSLTGLETEVEMVAPILCLVLSHSDRAALSSALQYFIVLLKLLFFSYLDADRALQGQHELYLFNTNFYVIHCCFA